ncbi:MAG: hypothetical protein D6759_04375 [Chloroflexi bacterium]|nr:MAG: hypothetical protein D6759_04375 [Chloroflexota bacterium]
MHNQEEMLAQIQEEGLLVRMVVHPGACPVCKQFTGKVYFPDEAPSLPIKGCMRGACRCRYGAFDPDGPSLEELLRLGIAAAKNGQKEEAQEYLFTLLRADWYHEQGWLWLSAVVDTDEERLECLQQVLVINPDNQAAQRGVELLQAKLNRGAESEGDAGEP